MAVAVEYNSSLQYLRKIFSTIPSQYLIRNEPNDNESEESSPHYLKKKKKNVFEKKILTEAAKKAKRIKLDPEQNQILDADATIDEAINLKNVKKSPHKSSGTLSHLKESSSSFLKNSIPNGNVNELKAGIIENEESLLTVENLREKLHNKILELQKQRNYTPLSSTTVTSDMTSVKEKTRSKKKSKEENLKNRKDAKKSYHKNKSEENHFHSNNASSLKEKKSEKMNNQPLFKENGQMIFSKFDLSNGIVRNTSTLSQNDRKKSSYGSLFSSDPKQTLEKLMKQKEKIEKLKQTDEQKASHIMDKESWKEASLKAQGEKVKNDPKLLLKTIKRKEKQKAKSAEAWSERKSSVEKSMQRNQEVRRDNIQLRRNGDDKDKKSKNRPGFEGVHFRRKR